MPLWSLLPQDVSLVCGVPVHAVLIAEMACFETTHFAVARSMLLFSFLPYPAIATSNKHAIPYT